MRDNFLYQKRDSLFFLCAAIVLVFGLAIRFLQVPKPRYIEELNPFLSAEVTISGRVVSSSVRGTTMRLVLSDVSVAETTIRSRVYVVLPRGQDIPKWSHVHLKGSISLWEGYEVNSFSNNVVISSMYYPEIVETNPPPGFFGFIHKAQIKLRGISTVLLPEPHASLLIGILFGIDSDFRDSFYESMKKVGLLHIVVASGFNALIVANVTQNLGRILGKYGQIATFSIFMLPYIALSGFQIPIIRAAIMAGGGVLASLKGEEKAGLWWLAISAYVLVLLEPRVISQPSFQLSFCASLGILLLAPVFEKFLHSFTKVLAGDLSTTIAAQFFTLPILYIHFGNFSPLGLLTNPLVLWMITPIMYWGFLCVLVSLVSPSVASVAITPVWVLLDVLVTVINTFS